LRDIDKTLVIQENDQPLAVLLKYEDFLAMQEQLIAVLETHSVVEDKAIVDTVLASRTDAAAGNTRSIEDVRESLRKSKKEKA
jgi:PHD/YefM family antitoxin component YafN of YafNO toxin-antitoxin module